MSRENYTPWDSAEYLDDDEAIMEYLRAALEENDLQFFMQAFDNAVRARTMNQKRIESSWLATTLSTSVYVEDHVIISGEEASVFMQDNTSLKGTQLVGTTIIPSTLHSDLDELDNLTEVNL